MNQLNNLNTRRIKFSELWRQALDLHKSNKYAEAIKAYQMCLAVAPNDFGSWINLGVALRATRQYQAALGCYRRALDLKPDDAGVMSNLGNALKDVERIKEALHYHERAFASQPDNSQYRLNYAVALKEAKQFEQALLHLDLLVKQQPDNAHYQWERGLIHLYLGNFQQGWVDYEARMRTGDMPLRDFGCQKWQGENLQTKKLLLVAEQGYGDTILAARFISVIKQRYPDCDISLDCKTELQPILQDLPLLGFLDSRTTRYQVGQFDYYCPLMSLMGVLGIDGTNIPAPIKITIPDASRHKFKEITAAAAGKLKIGIVWSGSLTFKDNAKRSCSLDQFLRLTELPNVQLYSLQKGEREKDLGLYQAIPLVIDLSRKLENFGDTAAAVQALDVIVMTDSSVAHLAGSLNKPIINLLQHKPYWLYYPESETTLWYSSMRLVRQTIPGDWDEVLSRVSACLAHLIKEKQESIRER